MITDPISERISDLYAGYEMLLRMLFRFFIHSGETDNELQTMCDAAVNIMFQIIKPLGLLLTTLPVGPGAPGMTAGPSFEMYRTGYILPHRHAAWVVIHERLLDLAANCVSLNTMQLSTPTREVIVYVEENLRQLAAALAQHIDR